MVDGSWDFLETLESHASVIAAALWALRDGPNLAWDSGINNLDVENGCLACSSFAKGSIREIFTTRYIIHAQHLQ